MSPEPTDHPPADRLRAYGDGRLPPEAAAGVEDHLAACAACCGVIDGAPTAALIDRLRAHPDARDWFDRPAAGPPGTPRAVGAELTPLPAGTRVGYFGDYELLGEIARGGMGVVYRAADTVLGREVAVKVLSDRFAPDAGAARRFTDEARIAGQLQHPGIPAVHAFGTQPDGRPFLVMKLVQGHTLDELLKDRPDPAGGRVRFLSAFEQVAQAVAYAHSRGVIHRDLKPQNVMVGHFGEVQVMDWGLAKVLAAGPPDEAGRPATETGGTEIRTTREAGSSTQAGSVLGTPAFMPPEQAGGETDRVDERADVFGLGAILCVILTGRPPYLADTAEAVRLMAVRGQLAGGLARLDACGADPELVDLCKRCLAADQDARPRDARAVADAVAAHLAAVEGRARRAEVARAQADARAAGERKRRRAQLALAAAVGLLLAGGGAFGWWPDKQAADRRAQATRNVDALDDLLDRCEQDLREGDADRAAGALAEADRRLPEEGGTAMADRAARCRAELALLRELDDIDDIRWTPVDDKLPDRKAVAARWRAAFARFGVVPGDTSADGAAAAVSGSLVRDRLLTALDLWLGHDPDPGVRVALRAVLRAVDPDSYRDLVRDAVAVADPGRVARLAKQPAALEQPPRFAAALGQARAIPAERRRAVLEAALWWRPRDLSLLMELGGTYPRKSREQAEGTRWYQAAVASYPNNIAALSNLGLALRAKGDRDEAATCLRRALLLDPTSVKSHINLGLVLREKRDLSGALAECREAVRLDPGYANARNGLGNVLMEKGDVRGAIAEYQEAIRLDAEFAMAHTNLGRALAVQNNLKGAVAEFREAIRLDPDFAPPRYQLGLALADLGQVGPALAECRAGTRLDPEDAAAHYHLGVVLIERTRDYDGAAAAFREAVRLNPRDHTARFNLGFATRARLDYAGAISHFREAARLDPNFLPAQFTLGQLLADDAVRDYAGAVTPPPGGRPARPEGLLRPLQLGERPGRHGGPG